MTFRATYLGIITALGLSACGSSDSNLDHYSAELSESIDRFRGVASAHHQQALAETDLGALQILEKHHVSDVRSPMDNMRDARNSMNSCATCAAPDPDKGSPLCNATNDMSEMMGEVATEVSRHGHAMEAALDITTARAEEQQHGSKMDALFERMLTSDTDVIDAMHKMMDDGVSMMCPMNSHMHL